MFLRKPSTPKCTLSSFMNSSPDVPQRSLLLVFSGGPRFLLWIQKLRRREGRRCRFSLRLVCFLLVQLGFCLRTLPWSLGGPWTEGSGIQTCFVPPLSASFGNERVSKTSMGQSPSSHWSVHHSSFSLSRFSKIRRGWMSWQWVEPSICWGGTNFWHLFLINLGL